MTVYIEVFLLDNFLMNMIILRLAGALCSIRTRILRVALASLAGALYAFIMFIYPELEGLFFKLIISVLMTALALIPRHFFSLGLSNSLRTFGKAVLSFYIATMLCGGAAWAILLASGSDYSDGLVMTVPLRVALISIALLAFFPRMVRDWVIRKKGGERIVLRVEFLEKHELSALVDSGNSLTEPLSGLPVVIAYSKTLGPITDEHGRPVPYSDLSGQGILMAYRPKRLEAYLNGVWKELDAYLGISNVPLKMGVDALIGTSALDG